MKKKTLFPVFQALLAAVLFGASAPLAKLLLGEVQPVILAALLYLGSGLGLATIKMIQNLRGKPHESEAQIERGDLPWLLGAIVSGGVLAPILLMVSLAVTPAATASLLLNFEVVATTLVAALIFREAIGKTALWAILLITLSGILLSWQPAEPLGFSLGALGVIGACFLWGLDNNLTRNISAKDPLSIVTWKGLCAGLTSLVIALVIGQTFPALWIVGAALLLGFFSYGFSIVLFIWAMREMGAARTSTLFGAAPFMGAFISMLLFMEMPNQMFFFALPWMIAGAGLLLYENHEHNHVHEAFFHNHTHFHLDDHHDHEHEDGSQPVTARKPHSHPHAHTPREHAHPHMPDIHHRHGHLDT